RNHQLKTTVLVQRNFASVPYNLNQLEIFHTDRGNEFKNQLIDDALNAFGIERSLSEKGAAVAKAAMFKTIKTEFVNDTIFPCQQALDLEFFDYMNWFNNIRNHRLLNPNKVAAINIIMIPSSNVFLSIWL